MDSPPEKSLPHDPLVDNPPSLVSSAASTPEKEKSPAPIRSSSNIPCCGKRPRTPPSEVLFVANNNKNPSSASEGSPEQQQQQQQENDQQQQQRTIHQLRSMSSFDPPPQQDDDDDKGNNHSSNVQKQPANKIRRSSPTPSEIEDDNDEHGEIEEELLRINQPQDEKVEASSTEEDTKKESLLLLPLAPTLKDYMKSGATLRFRPRPEWYQVASSFRTDNNSRDRRASTPIPALPAGRSTGQMRRPPQLPSILERIGQWQPDDNDHANTNTNATNDNNNHGGLLLEDGFFDMLLENNMNDRTATTTGDQIVRLTATNSDDQYRAFLYGPSPRNNNNNNNNNSSSKEAGRRQQQQREETPQPASTFGRDCDPALHVTIRENATEAALALVLDWGASHKSQNAKGITPLILASQKGNSKVVRELLRRGAVPSQASTNGTTAVLQASHFGHLDCLVVLFENSSSGSASASTSSGGTSLLEMANYNQTTPLMRAAQEGHVHVVQLLLDRGASVNRRNLVQMTALMLASQRGHADVCRVLIQKGADLDVMTAQNSTSLLLACKRAHVDVVRTLITAGCELWVPDSRGRTAREIAQRREIKPLAQILDANVQLDLMQRQQRQQRSYDMILLWNLLQQERAMVPVEASDQYERRISIHQIARELQPQRVALTMHNQLQPQPLLPPTLPYHLTDRSTQALLRTMSLPAPLVELVAKFLPPPNLWEKRLGMLTRRSAVNADATVACALDLVDEILEEGGFVEACDFANVTPPTHFARWRDWRVYCRLQCRRGGPVTLPNDQPRTRLLATTATVPVPSETPALVEMRRQVGFLQILANRAPTLAHVLGNSPYHMPQPLIQQLITTSDIQSLVRRMGSQGIHFESTVAMDLIMLVSRLMSWYTSARHEEPYPIYPGVVHPPLPQRRYRPLPLRVPMMTVAGAQVQYQPDQQNEEVDRQRPSAPAPGN